MITPTVGSGAVRRPAHDLFPLCLAGLSLALLFSVVVIHLRFTVLPVVFLGLGLASYLWDARKALVLFLFLLPLVNSTPDLFPNGYPFNCMAIALFYLSGMVGAALLKGEELKLAFPGRGPYLLFLALLGVSLIFVFLRWSNLAVAPAAFLRDTPVAPSGERVSFAVIFPAVSLALFALTPWAASLIRRQGMEEDQVFLPLKLGFCLSFLLAVLQRWAYPELLAPGWWSERLKQVNGGFSDFNAFGFFAGALFLHQSLRLADGSPRRATPAAADGLPRSRRWRNRLFDIIFMAVALGAIFLSGCRTAFLFVILALVVILFSRTIKAGHKLLILIFLLAALAVAGGTLRVRLERTAEQAAKAVRARDNFRSWDQVSNCRLALLKDSVAMISRFPLSGVGAGNFLFYLNDLHFSDEAYRDLPLNQYLLVFSETGVFGGIAFAAFMLLLLARLRPGRMRIVVAAMALALLLNHFFWFPECLLLFWIVLARAEWADKPAAGKRWAWAAALILAAFIAANLADFRSLHPATWALEKARPYYKEISVSLPGF